MANKIYKYLTLILKRMANPPIIKTISFDKKNYCEIKDVKRQIVLHHTASGGTGEAVARYFDSTPERVAVAIVIDRDGQIKQLFDPDFFGYHLGVDHKDFAKVNLPYMPHLDQKSLAIELISWGFLNYSHINNTYTSWAKKTVPAEEVIFYDQPFNGYSYFQKYTKEQILSLERLLIYWNYKYRIPLKYKYDLMFKQNKDALIGYPGMYSHVSFRGNDKTDLHPQPDLIEMFKRISKDYLI
jgi:hypothetical protein